MKVIGLMIKPKEKESICMLMDQCILDNGSVINSMDMVNRNGLMGQNTKEILRTE